MIVKSVMTQEYLQVFLALDAFRSGKTPESLGLKALLLQNWPALTYRVRFPLDKAGTHCLWKKDGIWYWGGMGRKPKGRMLPDGSIQLSSGTSASWVELPDLSQVIQEFQDAPVDGWSGGAVGNFSK